MAVGGEKNSVVAFALTLDGIQEAPEFVLGEEGDGAVPAPNAAAVGLW